MVKSLTSHQESSSDKDDFSLDMLDSGINTSQDMNFVVSQIDSI